jgi:hypothetical protein
MARLFALLLLTFCFADNAHAYGYGKEAPVAYPTPKTASRLGNVTGNDCTSNSDCMQGCMTDDKESKILCITKAEGSQACLKEASPPPGGLTCECLSDVKHCGYVFPRGSR